MSQADQLERELRWMREARAVVTQSELGAEQTDWYHAHLTRFPVEYKHYLKWDEDRLDTAISRQESDLKCLY